MNKVVAIVVTYNRKELLQKCINRIRSQTVKSDIFIIDNNSTDGTGKLFEEENFKNLYYFNTGCNIGGAGGFNYGMKKAVELGYQYLWLMDDDTMPTETALEALLKSNDELEEDYGFLSSKVLWKDNSLCVMNKQRKTKWRKLHSFNIRQSIQYASFVSCLIRAETVIKFGLPYKDFFIWGDDWEYTRRISKCAKCYYIPDSIVVHFCASNKAADIVSISSDRIDRFQYKYRNDVVLYRQDGIEGYLYLILRNISYILRILVNGKEKRKKIILLFKYTNKGMKFFPSIEYPAGE